MTQLFQATEYLHLNNICHRDLKPDNIMISKAPLNQTGNDSIQIKLIDFIVAFVVDPKSQKIQGATVLREWSAPETRRSNCYDFKIDCWTLGCVMYLICTGDQPFEAEDRLTMQINFKKKFRDYSMSQRFPQMVNFIDRLIRVDPDERMSAK